MKGGLAFSFTHSPHVGVFGEQVFPQYLRCRPPHGQRAFPLGGHDAGWTSVLTSQAEVAHLHYLVCCDTDVNLSQGEKLQPFAETHPAQ